MSKGSHEISRIKIFVQTTFAEIAGKFIKLPIDMRRIAENREAVKPRVSRRDTGVHRNYFGRNADIFQKILVLRSFIIGVALLFSDTFEKKIYFRCFLREVPN